MGSENSAPTPTASHGGSRPSKERHLEDLEIEGTKRLQCGEGCGRGRGRGNRGSSGRFSSNTCRIDFDAIA
jgi:hypothetical protein